MMTNRNLDKQDLLDRADVEYVEQAWDRSQTPLLDLGVLRLERVVDERHDALAKDLWTALFDEERHALEQGWGGG